MKHRKPRYEFLSNLKWNLECDMDDLKNSEVFDESTKKNLLAYYKSLERVLTMLKRSVR